MNVSRSGADRSGLVWGGGEAPSAEGLERIILAERRLDEASLPGVPMSQRLAGVPLRTRPGRMGGARLERATSCL
jgi:hypothetical protein